MALYLQVGVGALLIYEVQRRARLSGRRVGYESTREEMKEELRLMKQRIQERVKEKVTEELWKRKLVEIEKRLRVQGYAHGAFSFGETECNNNPQGATPAKL